MQEGVTFMLCFEEDNCLKPLPEEDCSRSEFDTYSEALSARDELIESDDVVIVLQYTEVMS